jgi:hypothetical protein
MATALQTIATTAPTDPAKLMSQPETWALADSQFSSLAWDAAYAAKQFHPASLPRLIAAHDAALAPVSDDWLQKRLRLLWKSSVVNGSLDATAWLHETGRLLADIPQDILADAIDSCVKSSERGFMPTVGQIRAVADPRMQQRETHAARLRSIERVKNGATVAKEEAPRPRAQIDSSLAESTADILKRVWPTMGKHEPGYDDKSEALNLDPNRPTRKPTRADYIRMGVEPSALEGMA